MAWPEREPVYDYEFRLHAWHERQAAEIAWHHRHLMIATSVGVRSVLHTMSAYTAHPYRTRGRQIPRDTLNVIRAHAAAARRIERKVNGHA